MLGRYAILLNGPPRCGKDTGADAILQQSTKFGLHPSAIAKIKISDTVKLGTHASYGLDCGIDHYEQTKEIPQTDFFGLSPRAAYIKHSELYMKKIHGEDVLGRITARRMANMRETVFLLPGVGFAEEVTQIVDLVGQSHVLLLRIHRDGCSFDDDSRSYLQLEDVRTYDLENRDVVNYLQEVVDTVRRWLDVAT